MTGSDSPYRLSDILFWSYNGVVAIFLLLTGHRVEYRWWFFLSNLSLIVLNILLIHLHHRHPGSRGLQIARNWYPFFYFSYLHWESGMLRYMFHTHTFDPLVKSWDLALLGDYLHNILYQYQPIWFSEFIHFTYFFYYVLILIPPLLYYRDDMTRFAQYMFDITLLYLIHYTIFYVFPVVGPIALHLERFQDGILFIPLMKILYIVGDSPGGAMPSSHVSVALLAWYWLWRYKIWMGAAASFFVLCLIFSTVYLSYHYAIDTVAGLLAGTLFILAMTILRRCLAPSPVT